MKAAFKFICNSTKKKKRAMNNKKEHGNTEKSVI